MGPRQVSRVALVATLAALPASLALSTSAAAQGAPRSAPAPASKPADRAPGSSLHTAPSEPIAVVDLRTGDAAARARTRGELALALDGIQGVRVRRDNGLVDALAGEGSDLDTASAQAAIDEARQAFGALDCARARPAAERAVDLLAARQAAGLADGAALRAAWAYALLCADHDGDAAAAHRAATALRSLGVSRGDEVGVSASTWERFPEIDAATDRNIVELTVLAPAGAAVWIDHVAVGAAPLTTFVHAGEHVVAAASAPGAARTLRGATRVRVGARPVTVEVAIADATSPWVAVGSRVQRWRAAGTRPDGAAITRLLRALRVRMAVVLVGDAGIGDTERWGDAELWGQAPRAATAERLETRKASDALGLGASIADRAATWDGRGPDPDQLVRAARSHRDDQPRWWIYASIVGAVVAGGAVIYAQDSAQDRQRVEVSWP